MPIDALSTDAYKRNALFRVLAFMDSTGVQSFDLVRDVDAEGRFRDPQTLFGKGTAMHAVLAVGITAFRDMIRTLFADPQEREALLAVVGTGPTDAEAEDRERQAPEATERHPNASSVLWNETGWGRAVQQPETLRHFTDTFSGSGMLNVRCRLEEVIGVPAAVCTDDALVQEFLTNALGAWMEGRTEAENAALILACGVQPAVLATAMARREELPHALVDFVIDVVFPPVEEDEGEKEDINRSQSGAKSGAGAAVRLPAGVVDWLLLTYQHNHESIDVEADESCGSEVESPSQRQRQEEGERTGNSNTSAGGGDDGLGGWQPPEDELVLTADNIDRFMRENPSIIPRELIQEKRRSWLSPEITAFELEHHYTAAELKAAVKALAGLRSASEEALAVWEAAAAHEHGYRQGSATVAALRAATSATRKAECVAAILRLHDTAGGSQKDAEPTEGTIGSGAEPMNKANEPRHVAYVGDPSLSAAQLMGTFLLKELQVYIRDHLEIGDIPATKKKCVDLILMSRKTKL